jgi:uncharacterized protein YeaO (DUF488 family)
VGHNRDFAPTWEMVRGHQTRTMNNREYTRRYLAILEALPIQAWRKLTAQAKNNTLVFLCYCLDETTDGARKFCHTHIICDYLLNRWPQFFRDGRK